MTATRGRWALVALLGSVTGPGIQAQVRGIYSGSDGGTYYVREVTAPSGRRLYWFGEHATGGFANVMSGEINAAPGRPGALAVRFGEWWDVPKGRANNVGVSLELLVEGGSIQRLGGGAGFRATNWTLLRSDASLRPMAPATLTPGFTSGPLSGAWLGNDGGIYYINHRTRDTGGNMSLVWFGEGCLGGSRPAFANVFVSQNFVSSGRDPRVYRGQWVDIPYGMTSNNGNLDVTQAAPTRLVRSGVSGGFGGTTWWRTNDPDLRRLPVTELRIAFTTWGDDLRGGAVAYGTVSRRGLVVPEVNLNSGRGLSRGSTMEGIIPLPAGTSLADLERFILRLDGAGRNVGESYDNWDVGAIRIRAMTSQGAVCLGNFSGTPFVRLTGERPTREFPIALPR